MSGAKKQDWGDYSTILRSAFHHETVSSTRKTDNQYDEINDPCLAVALTGTPAQAPRLLSSAEDGLFSRFLFYAYKNKIVWQDPSPQSHTIVYNDHFEVLSQSVLDMIGFFGTVANSSAIAARAMAGIEHNLFRHPFGSNHFHQ